MPTSSDFYTAATELQSVADDAEAAARDLRTQRDGAAIENAAIRITVDNSYTELAHGVDLIAQKANGVADIFTERAKVCEAYTEQMREYKRALSRWSQVPLEDREGRTGPTEPTRPASWAESSV